MLHELVSSGLVQRTNFETGYSYELTNDLVALEIRNRFTLLEPTPEQISQVKAALKSGFDVSSLRWMLKTRLNENLSDVVPFTGRTFRQMVDDLVYYYATQPNGLQHLINAAYIDNPGNRELASLLESVKDIQFAAVPSLQALQDALMSSFSPTGFRHMVYFRLNVDLRQIFQLGILSFRQLVDLVVRYFEAIPNGLSQLVAAGRGQSR